MRNSILWLVAATVTCVAPAAARADVVVRFESGTELRALRAWRDGDAIKVQLATGLASFPATTVVAIDDPAPASRRLPPSAGRDPVEADDVEESDAADAVENGGAAEPVEATATPVAPKYAPMVVDEKIATVPHEDLQTRMERLDGLSMQTRRQLSVARTQGQSKETLEALERKIKTIDEQRVETMGKLGGSR